MIRTLKRLLTQNRQSKATTAASTLAKIGAEKRARAWVAKRNAVARQLRRERGLPPSKVLEA